MNRLDTAYSQGLLPQSPLTKDNLIRGKEKLKEQVEYLSMSTQECLSQLTRANQQQVAVHKSSHL